MEHWEQYKVIFLAMQIIRAKTQAFPIKLPFFPPVGEKINYLVTKGTDKETS